MAAAADNWRDELTFSERLSAISSLLVVHFLFLPFREDELSVEMQGIGVSPPRLIRRIRTGTVKSAKAGDKDTRAGHVKGS
jgi:hypothetical protein